ncbi:MAG: polysaccharide biosynthesis protein [Bacteroidaceae bacterium]|nr:polysaccharide biosynthesis protein [Bacteroidaceae bacterium]
MKLFNKIFNWYFRKDALPYWCIILMDCLLCIIAGLFILWVFFRGDDVLSHWGMIMKTLLLYQLCNLVGFRIYHTYQGVFRYSSFVDLSRVALALVVGSILFATVNFLEGRNYIELNLLPLTNTEIFSIGITSILILWSLRILVKMLYENFFANSGAKRTFIYGVKSGGVGLAKNIRNQKPTRFILKGFLADDKASEHKELLGKRIFYIDQNLPNLLKDYRIEAVLVSPLRLDAFRQNGELQDMLMQAGVQIYLSESLHEWSGEGDMHVSEQLKEVSIEDLLPRDEINVDMDTIGEILTGSKIMVTGSAGSIGSEIVRQVAAFKPEALMLIDQAETPQHDIRLMMEREFPEIKTETVVTSIAKRERMEKIFQDFRPDYIFHAAAYKHVPMMEDNPCESVENNVVGTQILADLAVKYGTTKFVMISTDKAVNPTNVMGCSKRICEIYVQSLNEKLAHASGNAPATQFVTTRFGNVLGSNGSVIPLFTEQIKQGGPVTVTDPNIIRYFMLIPEACKLVLEAGTKGQGGEIFVFDMGAPVRISDLAKRMIYLSGAKNIQIKYTGLREGEKLYEEVLNHEEKSKPTFHKKIRIAEVRKYDYDEVCRQLDELVQVARTYDAMETVRIMKRIVPEYKSNNSVYSILDK